METGAREEKGVEAGEECGAEALLQARGRWLHKDECRRLEVGGGLEGDCGAMMAVTDRSQVRMYLIRTGAFSLIPSLLSPVSSL